jgi:hypothetical protein
MYAPQPERDSIRNVNMLERWLSMIGGGALTTFGLRKGGLRGLLLSLAGGYLAQRGLTGHCAVYQALGMDTSGQSRQAASFDFSQSRGEHSYDVQADQAEGERNNRKSTRVGTTPGSAEGDRATVEADLQAKGGY